MPTSTSHFDYIIAGSGTSGGVAAWYLQQAGARCLLLEAGKYYKPREDFPLPEADYTAQLMWGGGIEYNTRCDLAFIRGRCVGGGSVVNAALMDRFDDVAFDDWKAASGVPFFSESAMEPHYDFAETQIALEEIPDHHRNNNAQLFIKGMENCGHVWKPLRRCQSDCPTDAGQDCIACLGGCHRNSKQSTLATYIPKAEALGLEVRDYAEVTQLEYGKDAVTVHTPRGVFTADKVILAGGAFGSTQVLLRSGFRAKLPALGRNFSMHPQAMNLAVFDEPVDSHKGVLQGAKSLDPGFRKRGFKLENVFAPPIAIAVLFGRVGLPLQDFMRKYRNLACIEVAVRDENTGVIDVDKNGRLHIEKKMTDQDRRRMRDGLGAVKAMLESVGAKQVIQCKMAFGLHLMGGCVMGTDRKTSVVNPNFEVHDHPRLCIADSSIFPNAPGINPALTIMALSHRMATTQAAQ
ncbi:MAG: GMC family oxidoreductase [Candidatus Hydrogenedentes bacterium]|nr:GMC family oxidoreductase [Candidatus Hydrogenedentota bacterium]